MKTLKHTLYVSIAVVMNSLPFGEGWGGAYAQKILKDTMIHVVKSFQPTIADAYKINDLPVVKDSVPPVLQLSYAIRSKKINTPFTVEPLKPAKMVGEPLTKLYSSFVKVGGGNYNTPYAEAFYNNLRSKDISYGAHLKHFSSKATLDGYGFGGLSDNQAELYAKKFLRKHTLSGNVDYNRNAVHYYGYDTALVKPSDNSLTKQVYANIGVNTALQSHYTDSLHINYLLKLKYYNHSDSYNTLENNINASADFSGYYEKQLIHLPLNVDFYNNKATTVIPNSLLLGLAPYITSSGEKWSTSIGLGIAMENQQDNKKFLFFPNIDFNYNIADNIIVPFAGIRGGIKRNSLKLLTQENPFLVPNPDLASTSTKEFYGGLRGSVSKSVSYTTRATYSFVDDLCLFASDNTRVLKKGFNTVYDNAKVLNLMGELQYQQTEKIKFIAKGEYNKYTMKNEDRAWQRPAWQTTLSVNYNLKSKIVATADVFAYGKRFDREISTNGNTVVVTTKELKPILDANIGLEYRYSKKLSAFLNMNNLGFARYYYWNNYPSYKFNFLAGVTVVF